MITTKDLTGGEVEGAGVFDELMRTVKAHLDKEQTAGRITDQNYATVYLGALQNTLNTASQFLLQVEQTNQQTLLLQEQVKQAKKQNELLDLQKAQLTVQNATAQYNLDFTMPEQLAQLKEQTKLITQQKHNAVTQNTLLTTQNNQATQQIAVAVKQEELLLEQIESAKDEHTNPTGGLNKAAYDKTVAETSVLNQRKLTEEAQTVGEVGAVGGVLGTQMKLVDTQKEGFLRDAEQKAAKIFSDAFSIVHSITPDTVDNGPNAFGLGKDEANQVMDQLRVGIGLPVTAPDTGIGS